MAVVREKNRGKPCVAPEQDRVLNEVLRRVVAAYEPDRVYLFGSRARGEQGRDSDYDLMVVVPESPHRGDAGAGLLTKRCGVWERRSTCSFGPADNSTGPCI